MPTHTTIDSLQQDLEASVSGDVRFDDGSRALYATDASNYRQVPIGLVVPRHVEDIVATIAACRHHDVPVLMRGGGTSLAGQCCNAAVVLDTSRHVNRILEVDPEGRRARVQPGVVLDDLRDAAERHHLTFGPDPATHTHCTLGGMIGNNSCGIHSVMAGRTVDNVEELEVLTYDGLRMRVGPTSERELQSIIDGGGRRGEIYRALRELSRTHADEIRRTFPQIPRRVSGYNLNQLLPENGFNVARALVGTEGTCVTVLEATVRLVPSPPVRSLLVLGYPDAYTAADHVMEILEYGPVGLEGIDHRLVGYMRKKELHLRDVSLLPDGGGWLLVEFGGDTKEESDAKAERLMHRLKKQKNPPSMRLYEDPAQEAKVWEVRESGLGATAFVPGEDDTWPGWEDSAVAPEHLSEYLRKLRALFNRYDYDAALYGHFGDGCVHCRINFDLVTAAGIDKYRRFIDDAADLVVSCGGSLSGEHGDGQSRGALLPKMYGEDIVEAFEQFKGIWDPRGRMNPGKVVDPYQPTENLRLGTDYRPENPPTRFKWPKDDFTIDRAALRCVGVGKCRRQNAGTMCPSYMVTHEEKHATRGRAHLLFEMLQGEVITDGWKSESVREALDLCLACKGCTGQCPVNVDIPSLKAEFYSHHYEGRLRPRAHYSMGLIHWVARAASLAPRLVNAVMRGERTAPLVKWLGGIAQQREMPAFAEHTFRSWLSRNRPDGETHGTRMVSMTARDDDPVDADVILWADTFTNYFEPQIAEAAVEVLEDAGLKVAVPSTPYCCGRPLYDFGMLDAARRLLRQILDGLRPEIRAGLPVIVLEPSCASTFRDELVNMYPNDPDATRLARQTFLLSEFLTNRLGDYDVPTLDRRALVHGHCHHKSLLKFDDQTKVLDRLGLDYDVVDSGCCGMAGSFGFEAEKYDVSVACADRVLVPKVRAVDEDTLIVADGFSCREQIRQQTGRHAMHLAEVMRLAIRERAELADRSGAHAADGRASIGRGEAVVSALVAGAAVAAGGALLWKRSTRRNHDQQIA